MEHPKQKLWQSYDGAIRSFNAMDDEHVANIIQHCIFYKHARGLVLALQEADRRKLSEAFLNGAQYPYKSKVTGDWMIWDFNLHRPVKINGEHQ